MKNRKRVIITFLVIAALLLGVGYAAFTDVLVAKGDFEASAASASVEFDANVYFLNETGGDDTKHPVFVQSLAADSSGEEKYSLEDNGDSLILNVTTFNFKNDTIVVRAPIVNKNVGFDANLVLDKVTTNATYEGGSYKYSYFVSTDPSADYTTPVSNTETVTVPANGTVYLFVKVTLDKNPDPTSATPNVTGSFRIEYDVTAVEVDTSTGG